MMQEWPSMMSAPEKSPIKYSLSASSSSKGSRERDSSFWAWASTVITTIRGQQQGMHDNGVHGWHDHALTVVEPLQVFAKAGIVHRRFQAAVLVALQDVIDDGAALPDLLAVNDRI